MAKKRTSFWNRLEQQKAPRTPKPKPAKRPRRSLAEKIRPYAGRAGAATRLLAEREKGTADEKVREANAIARSVRTERKRDP